MKIYIVGGAVRDELLGLAVKDRDYVVVGARPEDLIAQGYRPVGRDFPVFLHPQTHCEYALARTERKTAPGYHGFSFHADPNVTLEEDLARRDLTINAIARSESGELIDPYNGVADLHAKTLRHVSPAFVEDPVRILRVARFAARFVDFQIAPETIELMRNMVAAGEVEHLVAERVWQELSRGLMEAQPSRMLRVLRECGALVKILPEVDQLFGVPQPVQYHPEVDTGEHILHVIDQTAVRGCSLEVRFAALMHDLGKGTSPRENLPHHYAHEVRGVPLVEQLCERLRVPRDCRDLALIVAREHGAIHGAMQMKAGKLTQLLERLDILRRPQRFEEILQACACDFHGRPGYENRVYEQSDYLRQLAQAFQSVDAGEIARNYANAPTQIAARLHEARVHAITDRLHTVGDDGA